MDADQPSQARFKSIKTHDTDLFLYEDLIESQLKLEFLKTKTKLIADIQGAPYVFGLPGLTIC